MSMCAIPMIDFAACVRRGAMLLDRKHPGWASKIDAARLNLGDGCDCVLGQLYGSYTGGALKVEAYVMTFSLMSGFHVEVKGADFGFALPRLDSDELVRHGPKLYAVLDELWIAEIEARLRPAPPAAIEPLVPAATEVLELQLV